MNTISIKYTNRYYHLKIVSGCLDKLEGNYEVEFLGHVGVIKTETLPIEEVLKSGSSADFV
ncbi:MAG: hypothetical protein NC083_08760 [Muribaculum sp.]|nr:hypothetical protein [Muribaculum sp.]MCM1577049.1 hypothetical protein [Bacteroides sp.]